MTPADLQPANPAEPSRPRAPAPLLPVAIGLILGIAVDGWLTLSVWMLLACGLAGSAVMLLRSRVAGRFSSLGRRGAVVGVLGLTLAAAGLGGLRHAEAVRYLPEDHICHFTASEPRLITMQARVLTPVTVMKPSEQPARGFEPSPSSRFVVDALAVAGTAGDLPASGRVAVRVRKAALDLRIGDVLRVTGWLYQPSPPRNPGGYDWAEHQRRNGVFAAFSCKLEESVGIERRDGGGWRGAVQQVRSRLTGYLVENTFPEDDPGGGVVAAMVLAQRSAVPRTINEAFVRTGNVHFLAASGMNVAWLIAAVYGCARLLGVYYRTAAILVICFILSYLLLAEPEPSILRAGIAGLLWCWAVILRGSPCFTNWLACSAIVILLINPTDVFRPAFQLSFVAVLGLVHLTSPVRYLTGRALARLTAFKPLSRVIDPTWFGSAYAESVLQEEESRRRWFVRGCARHLHTAVAVSMAAWLSTLPLTCYHFNQFTPWGWFGTLLLILPAFLVTLLGYLMISVGLLIPPIGWLLAPLLGVATRLMLGGVAWLDAIPGTVLDGRSPGLAWLLAVYAACGLGLLRVTWLGRNHGRFVLAVVLLVWWLIPPRWVRAEHDALHVWILAVGHGQAIVLELPDDRTIICDFGTRSAFGAEQTGLDLLRHRGISRVDAVFISHANLDHYNGLPTLAEKVAIGQLIINDWHRLTAGRGADEFLAAMKQRDIPVRVTSGPCELTEWLPAEVSVLWPPVADGGAALDANESSTVLRVEYQGRAVLIPGDIGPAAMNRLVAERGCRAAGAEGGVSLPPAPLHADVLVLPHHGAVVSGTRSFLAAVDPAVVVRSSGEGRRMTVNGIEAVVAPRCYYNTTDDGCIHLRIRRGQIEAAAFQASD